MIWTLLKAMVAATILAMASIPAAAEDTLKIGYIDPLSGPFGNAGDAGLKHFRYAAELINQSGGIAGMKVEIIPFDNKINPKESLVQLQKAIDKGIRVVTQGNGSSVANALTDAVNKHNRRNPGEEVIYLNYAAVDPALTNRKCNFWHFRFDASADMKVAGLTDWLVNQKDIKSIYIIGQDYSFGRAVADAAVQQISERRPDIKIVGNELHPIGKVKDFTPYVQKIMNSKADAVITGNWGTDMTLLIKAADAAGHKVPYLTLYGGGLGAPTAMGRSAVGLVKQVTEFHENIDTTPEQNAKVDDFEKKNPGVDYYYERVFTMMNMFGDAINKVGKLDVIAVAKALEGATYETPYGTVTMRAEDHQLIQPLYISTFSDGVERDVENTGFGFKTDFRIEAEKTVTPTTCKMRRPK